MPPDTAGSHHRTHPDGPEPGTPGPNRRPACASIPAWTEIEFPVPDPLTAYTARPLCRAVREQMEAGAGRFLLNLEPVRRIDVVGVAALLQSVRLAMLLGVEVAVLAGPSVYRALVSLEILDELPLVSVPRRPAVVVLDSPPRDPSAPIPQYLAHTARVGLRLPRREEVSYFAHWSHDVWLDHMVGSGLLYCCRHLGPDDPHFLSLLFDDPTCFTLLIQPIGAGTSPVGFARLHNIRLLDRLAFLEIAIADTSFLRKGWGIEAARLLVAYGADVLGLRRIEAKVFAYNLLSANSLKRNGFQQEGVLRQAKFYNNEWWDILVYSLLEGEMAEQRTRTPLPSMGFWG